MLNAAELQLTAPRPAGLVARAVRPMDVPAPIAKESPLFVLDVDGNVPDRIRSYCAYVGFLITASGVAAALGIGRASALNWLAQLGRDGVLRRAKSSFLMPRPRTGGPRPFVWEYVAEEGIAPAKPVRVNNVRRCANYCGLRRRGITTIVVAGALGISRHRAAKLLRLMAARGKVYQRGRLHSGHGPELIVWEWRG